LDSSVRQRGQEVFIPEPSPNASIETFSKRIYFIELEYLQQLIQRDGFGKIYWNYHTGEEAFVTMEVVDEGLVADFIKAGVLSFEE
jgi:hypothetical protein